MSLTPNPASDDGTFACHRRVVGTTRHVFAWSHVPVCAQQEPRVQSCRLFQQLRGDVMSPTLTVTTVPWGFPCTVSTDTCLFPGGLDMNLADIELAATPGIKTCFLCTRLGMSPGCAARLAKQLAAELICTVGDFLGLTHEECMARLPREVVTRLDRFIKGCQDIHDHAAPGTRGGCRFPIRCITPRLTARARYGLALVPSHLALHVAGHCTTSATLWTP